MRPLDLFYKRYQYIFKILEQRPPFDFVLEAEIYFCAIGSAALRY